MYPITSAGLAALREDVVQSVNILCTPTKGTAFNITDKDIIGAVTVDWSSVTGSKLDLGSACMSELSFTLENTNGAFDDKVFEGAQLYVTTSFSTGSTTETVPIGYYTVDSPPRKLRSIKITAYDRMAKFNRAYDTELAYPATLYQIVADACTKCGVSQKLPTNTLHRGVSIPKRPEADNLTYRQVLVWAAELMGVSLYIDYDGKLTGGWYATNAKHTVIKASDRFTSGNTDFAENSIVFSGVRIVGNDGSNQKEVARDDGSFSFALQRGVKYVMLAGAKGYLNQKQEFASDSTMEDANYWVEFILPSISKPSVVETIFYDYDKADLRPESKTALNELIAVLHDNPNVTIEMASHTDRWGSDAYNINLSERRAKSVVDYLVENGISRDRLQPHGYGKSRPKTVTKRIARLYPQFKEGDILTEEFIKTLSEEDQQAADQINRRTEFSVLSLTYNMK